MVCCATSAAKIGSAAKSTRQNHALRCTRCLIIVKSMVRPGRGCKIERCLSSFAALFGYRRGLKRCQVWNYFLRKLYGRILSNESGDVSQLRLGESFAKGHARGGFSKAIVRRVVTTAHAVKSLGVICCIVQPGPFRADEARVVNMLILHVAGSPKADCLRVLSLRHSTVFGVSMIS
jgi:hypothetical protein